MTDEPFDHALKGTAQSFLLFDGLTAEFDQALHPVEGESRERGDHREQVEAATKDPDLLDFSTISSSCCRSFFCRKRNW